MTSERQVFTLFCMATKKFLSDIKKWRKRKADMLVLIAADFDMAYIARRYKISRQRVRQIVNGR